MLNRREFAVEVTNKYYLEIIIMASLGVPALSTLFPPRDPIVVYPDQDESPVVNLFQTQAALMAKFNSQLEEFKKQQEREFQLLEKTGKDLQDEQKALADKIGKAQSDIGETSWDKTALGEAIQLDVDTELGKNIDFPTAVEFQKNPTLVAKFIEDWINHNEALKTKTPAADPQPLTLPDNERRLGKTELTRLTSALRRVGEVYDKFIRAENEKTVYEYLLNSPIKDLAEIDAQSGLENPDGTPKSLLPPNYENLKQFLTGVGESKLADILDTSRQIIINRLGTSSIVDPSMVADPSFMQAVTVVHVAEFFAVGLMQAELNNKQLQKELGLEYLTFTNKLSEIKLQALKRLGREVDEGRQLKSDPTQYSEEFDRIRDKLADLLIEINASKNYIPASEKALNSTMQNLIQTLNTLNGQLTNLMKDFEDSTIRVALIWPQLTDDKFNIGIVSRMKNEDIDVTKLNPQPEGARMTVSIQKNPETKEKQVRVYDATDKSVSIDDLGDISVGPPQGSCDTADIPTYREYQKFLAAYLFGKDLDPSLPPYEPGSDTPNYFDLSPYRGILANWGVGTGKTKGGMASIKLFFENFDERYDNGAIVKDAADLSNFVQLWVPKASLIPVWGEEIENLYTGRIKRGDPALFNTQTGGIFGDHWLIYPSGNLGKWASPSVSAFWIIDSGARAKYVTISLIDESTAPQMAWSQVPTNYIVHELRFPGVQHNATPALKVPKINPTTGELLSETQRFDEAFDEFWSGPNSTAILRFYEKKLKRYSPAVIFDEVHNWAKPAPVVGEAKKWRSKAWETYFKDWSWSKILALSATPIDPRNPNFEQLGQLIELLKYFPTDTDKLAYREAFPSGLKIEDLVKEEDGIKEVVSDTRDDKFFSKFLSYVSLNFDTTLYPYFNSLVCTADSSHFCIADGNQLLGVPDASTPDSDSERQIMATFEDTNYPQAPGKSENQQIIREQREWKYTVPNLIYAYLTAASLEEVRKNWDSWTNNALVSDPKAKGAALAKYRIGRLFDKTKFVNDEAPTQEEMKLLKPDKFHKEFFLFENPKITILPSDLQRDPTELNKFWTKVQGEAGAGSWLKVNREEQRISDIIGYTGTRIELKEIEVPDEADPSKTQTIVSKTIDDEFVVSQPLAVGNKVGASEKGAIAAKLLQTVPGKFIFVQTSANNKSIAYQNFWTDFWANFPKDLEAFQQYPEEWLSYFTTPTQPEKISTNPNELPFPDPWWALSVTRPDKDKKKKEFLSKVGASSDVINAAVNKWYEDNKGNFKPRYIFLASRYESAAKTRELFEPVGKFWQGLYNDKRNFDNRYFKGIFLGPESIEGTSFFDVGYHVNLNPPQNITVKTQAEGRAFRQCAHVGLAWHNTEVTAEVDASGGIRYMLRDTPTNGFYPQVKVITLIATIDPKIPNPSPMEITPDQLMASWIYKDPNMDGDIFLRYLQSLAVDNLLFGEYSHVRTPPGGQTQVEGLWSIVDELMLEAVKYVVTDPEGRERFIDYVERFYVPPIITDKEKKTGDAREVYQQFLENIIKESIVTEYKTNPSMIKDLFAKLVYFAGNSIRFPRDETLWDKPARIFTAAWWTGKRDEVFVGDTAWIRNTFLQQLEQKKAEGAKTILSDTLKIIERQAQWIKQMSDEYANYQDNFTLASYFARNPSQFLPELGYYEKLALQDPNVGIQEEWFGEAVEENLENGPNTYKDTWPIQS